MSLNATMEELVNFIDQNGKGIGLPFARTFNVSLSVLFN